MSTATADESSEQLAPDDKPWLYISSFFVAISVGPGMCPESTVTIKRAVGLFTFTAFKIPLVICLSLVPEKDMH